MVPDEAGPPESWHKLGRSHIRCHTCTFGFSEPGGSSQPRPGISVFMAQLTLFLCVLLGKEGTISEPLFPPYKMG